VDRQVQDRLAALAERVGRSRLFLLAEQVVGVLPTPRELHVEALQLKPIHPAQFLKLVEASTPRGHHVPQTATV